MLLLCFVTLTLLVSSAVPAPTTGTASNTTFVDDTQGGDLETSETGHFRRKRIWKKLAKQLSGLGGYGLGGYGLGGLGLGGLGLDFLLSELGNVQKHHGHGHHGGYGGHHGHHDGHHGHHDGHHGHHDGHHGHHDGHHGHHDGHHGHHDGHHGHHGGHHGHYAGYQGGYHGGYYGGDHVGHYGGSQYGPVPVGVGHAGYAPGYGYQAPGYGYQASGLGYGLSPPVVPALHVASPDPAMWSPSWDLHHGYGWGVHDGPDFYFGGLLI